MESVLHGGLTQSSNPPIHTDILLSVYSKYQDVFLVPITVATATAAAAAAIATTAAATATITTTTATAT